MDEQKQIIRYFFEELQENNIMAELEPIWVLLHKSNIRSKYSDKYDGYVYYYVWDYNDMMEYKRN